MQEIIHNIQNTKLHLFVLPFKKNIDEFNFSKKMISGRNVLKCHDVLCSESLFLIRT